MSYHNSLVGVQPKHIIQEAKFRLEAERTDEQLGLFSNWTKLNIAMLKYFRFNQVTLLAGLSGSGKSFILNMLRMAFGAREDIWFDLDIAKHIHLGETIEAGRATYYPDKIAFSPDTHGDFMYYPDSGLAIHDDGRVLLRGRNRNAKYSVIQLHFGFEMEAADEYIRSASTIFGKSYGYLLSSQYEETTKKYNKLNETELRCVNYILDKFANRREVFFESSGNVEQIYKTIADHHAIYPNHKFVISFDHSMLTRRLDEKSDMELQSSIAELSIRIRQNFGAMVIIIGQLNQSLESNDRRSNVNLHYPVKSDIHLGAQIYWACDNVIIPHRPELLHIERYGKDKLNTRHLIHFAVIKSRRGEPANIFFEEQFKIGRLVQRDKTHFL